MLYLNHKSSRLAILMLPIIFTACASRTELLFVSNPTGATITEIGTGTAFGKAPTTRKFNLDSLGSVNKEGCHTLNGVEAQWVSGARKQLPNLQLCGIPRLGYTITLVRPPAHPELEKDIEVANDLQASVDQAANRFSKLLSDTRMLENKRAMDRYGALRQQSEAVVQTRDQNHQ